MVKASEISWFWNWKVYIIIIYYKLIIIMKLLFQSTSQQTDCKIQNSGLSQSLSHWHQQNWGNDDCMGLSFSINVLNWSLPDSTSRPLKKNAWSYPIFRPVLKWWKGAQCFRIPLALNEWVMSRTPERLTGFAYWYQLEYPAQCSVCVQGNSWPHNP